MESPPPPSMEEEQQQQEHTVSSSCNDTKKRKKTRNITTMPLPELLIQYEILPWLPPKLLLLFRLVCKSWNSLFSTPAFVHAHLTRQHRHSGLHEDRLIIKAPGYDDGMCIVSHTRLNHVRSELVPCVRDVLVGSINGLVCMSALTGSEFCLWNPAIAHLKIFEMPSSDHHPQGGDCNHYLAGFCWDRVRNDYKVLLFCYDSKDSTPSQVLIYSTNSAEWTTLRIPDHIMLPVGRLVKSKGKLITSPSAIVRGISYWSYTQYLPVPGKKRRRKFISTFKFLPEVNEFRLLPDLNSLRVCGKEFNFVNIKDCLVGIAYEIYFQFNSVMVDMYSLDDEDCHSGGVWSKMYTIGPIGISFEGWLRLHCFKNGGEILIRSGGSISLYNPKSKETKLLVSNGSWTPFNYNTCYSYTPSLVCVKGMKSMETLNTC